MSKVRVVFFVDNLREHMDGTSNTMFRIIERMPDGNIDPIFITSMPPQNSDFPYPVYTCPSFDLPLYRGYRVAMPKLMRGLDRLVDEFDPHVIHWSTPSALGWFAVKYAAKKNIPAAAIYHTHFPSYIEYYFGFVPGIERLTRTLARPMLSLYNQTKLVMVPTESSKKYLESIGIQSGRIQIWGRGVNSQQFSPVHRREDFFDRFGVARSCIKILFVSRLAAYKETETLIRFSRLLGKDHQLIVTGEGPEKRRLMRKMPGVVFTGKLTGQDLSAVYASSDIFVFPSITETFGNVILEAMASGLPVIAANANGPGDLVIDGETGFLTDPRDEVAMVNKVDLLSRDAVLYKRLQDNGLKFAELQNWDTLCSRLFHWYGQLQLL